MSKHFIENNQFKMFPGTIIAYWLPRKFIRIFDSAKSLSSYANCCTGMQTGNNEKYIRMWYEIVSSNSQPFNGNGDWFRYNCGGDARKWYGNHLNLIYWKNNGINIRNEKSSVIRNEKYFFHEGITWKRIKTSTFSLRYLPKGFIFDQAGDSMFCYDANNLFYILGLVNSVVALKVLECISPSLNLTSGNMEKLPVIEDSSKKIIIGSLVNQNIKDSKSDWDSFEISWDFQIHPLAKENNMGTLISEKYKQWESECKTRFNQIKNNEEELNKLFIDIYGLEGEISPSVRDEEISIRLASIERDIKSLISYLVGIIMGRYSLDAEGLAYAGGTWDANKYVTYQPDDDGIVPIYTDLGMQDGMDTRIIALIKQIYGADTYRENIDFIAEALGKKNSESSEETLNRYLNDGFYADHLKIYQKRPIYWMFSSGKNSGFKCLIYMHRYNSDTLARINGKYFLPESTRLKNELDELLATIESATGSDRIRLEKNRQRLADKYREAIEYGQVLDHMANKYISIDLDDGVKVNYAKFQGVELVTDSGTKVKKDLLVPIK